MRRAALLGAATARNALDRLSGFDEIVVLEPSVPALEELVLELHDPRLDYMLGALPVLPLPDASVDLLVGEGLTGADSTDPNWADEVQRVLRAGGRAEPAG